MTTKTPLTEASKHFDLKFFLVGASGSGKTHFCGTYTKGPVHFYMTDRGGEKTLHKLIKERPTSAPPITIDIIPSGKHAYTEFWTLLQKDAKDGFFDHMAEQSGLVVIPDSITTINEMAKTEIASRKGIDLIQMSKAKDNKNVMDPALWGQLLSWMNLLVQTIQELPCATATPVHLFTETNSDGAIIRRTPSVNGQFRQTISINFDEVYLLECRSSKHNIHFKEHNYFEAKSRVFSAKKLTDFTMDRIASAYLSGDTLDDVKGGAPPILAKKKQ